jgi:hypothetical protein
VGVMPTYRLIHTQAVWERSSWLVTADSEDEARDKFHLSDADVAFEWKEVRTSVDGIDSEIESVKETDDGSV